MSSLFVLRSLERQVNFLYQYLPPKKVKARHLANLGHRYAKAPVLEPIDFIDCKKKLRQAYYFPIPVYNTKIAVKPPYC